MNQKEINELRRRFRPEKSAISRVYGCYVNSSKEIVSDLDESLGMMPQEESEKYLSLLKKGLSGSLGKNLIDIVFSTQQVVDSEEHRLLTTLRDSQLKDNEARQTFYHKVIDSLDMGDSSYLLLLTCDSYDVPHRGKDDSLQADASDEVFTYSVLICRLHLSAATVKESRQSGNRRLSFVSHSFSLLVPPRQGNGRSRFQTCDPAQSGIFQTRSLRRLWRSHASPGRCRGGSHAH